MSNPFLDLQEATAARLRAHDFLNGLAIVTETLGDVTNRVNVALVKGGVAQNDYNKAGLALLIITPKGRGVEPSRGAAQLITVRVAVFARPVINDGPNGTQKHPLEVHWSVQQQLLSWPRGRGQEFITLDGWDSRETPDGQLSYFSDFYVPLVLALT